MPGSSAIHGRSVRAPCGPAPHELSHPPTLDHRLFYLHHDPLFVCAANGSFLYVNPAFAGLIGFREEELLTRTLSDLCENPDGAHGLLEKVKSDGGRVAEECLRLRRGDGTSCDCLVKLASATSRSGRGVGVCYGSARDVTQHRRWGEMVAASERKYRLLFDQSLDAIAVVRPDGLLVDANAALLDLFGFSREDIGTLHTPSTYVEAAARDWFVGQLLSHQGPVKDEVLLRTKTGREFACARTGTVIHGQDGEVVGFQIVHRDITEQKKADEALRESREELRRLAVRIQETIESERKTIARELHDQAGQLLTGLKLEIQKLSRGIVADHPVSREDLTGLESLVDAAIDDVRRISAELRPGVLDDLGLVAAMEWQLGLFQKRTDIQCTLDAVEPAERLEEGVSTALYRVYQELLTNVARHAQASTLHVRFRCDSRELLLVVRDNGRGIGRQEAEQTTALGLIGIRERLLPFGGVLKLQGRPGKGTVATVRIPM